MWYFSHNKLSFCDRCMTYWLDIFGSTPSRNQTPSILRESRVSFEQMSYATVFLHPILDHNCHLFLPLFLAREHLTLRCSTMGPYSKSLSVTTVAPNRYYIINATQGNSHNSPNKQINNAKILPNKCEIVCLEEAVSYENVWMLQCSYHTCSNN